MTVTVKEATPGFDISNGEHLLILPENYYDKNGHRYYESSISFYKFAKGKLNIDFFGSPEVLLEQRSADWFGPVIFVSSLALTNNPHLISIATGVIANYLTDFFKGKGDPNVEVKIIYKESSKSKYAEIHYKGGSSGLSEINDAFTKIVGGNKDD